MIRRFSGNKVYLSVPDEDSLHHFVRWFQTPEHAETMGGGNAFVPYNKAYRIAEQWSNYNKETVPVNVTLTISLIKTSSPIGYVRVTSINWIARNAELSCFIEKKFVNRGLGADTLLTSIRFIFEELNLERFYGKVYNNNLNSLKMTASITNKIGELKEHCNGTHGSVDLSVYCLSRDEYSSKIQSENPFFRFLKKKFRL